MPYILGASADRLAYEKVDRHSDAELIERESRRVPSVPTTNARRQAEASELDGLADRLEQVAAELRRRQG